MANPFNRFTPKTKTAKIEALGGAEIKYRDLTLEELDEIQSLMIVGINQETKEPELDFSRALDVKYKKVALMLVEPKMTEEELRKLSVEAADAINEIAALGQDNDILDEEGK